MTLIVPAGEDSLPCISDGDDADSGCLARSPDDITKEDFGDECIKINLERENSLGIVPDKCEDTVKAAEVIVLSVGEPQKQILTPETLYVRDVTESDGLKTSELKVSVNCDKEVSTSSPLVIYECKIAVDTNPTFSSPDSQSTNSGSEHNSSEQIDTVSEEQKQSIVSNSSCENRVTNSVTEQRVTVSKCDECRNSLNPPLSKDALKTQSKQVESKENISGCKSLNTCFCQIQNKNDKTSRIGSANFLNVRNIIAISKVKDALCSVPTDEQKNRLRKLMQRRSVSESHSNDIDAGYLKRTRDKLRHSFSAYENCDKLHKILDKTLLSNNNNNKDIFIQHELVNNNVNTALSCENRMENLNSVYKSDEVSLEKNSLKSLEISDTLVNSVKKSMIEEYKNLKKNSSLALHNSYDENREICTEKASRTSNRSLSESSGCHINVREALQNIEMSRTEAKDHVPSPQSHGNTTPLPNSRIRASSEAETSSCASDNVSSVTDFQRSKSFPQSNSSAARYNSDLQQVENVSSPPTRLEIWKNILAEKRNSIKIHLKSFNKAPDNSIKDNSVNCADDLESLHKNEGNNFNENEFIADVTKIPSSTEHRNAFEEGNSPREHSARVKGTGNVNCNLLNNNCSNEHPVCDNFICINSLHILPCAKECSQSKPKRKSKLEEACHDIAKALDTLPVTVDTKENMNNKVISCGDIDYPCSLKDKASSIYPKLFCNISERKNKCAPSSIASIITTIPPPVYSELVNNEKGQQCPTPPACFSDDEPVLETKNKNTSTASEDDSDYCQTDECGDDCDYCSGDEAEDEEDDTCEICRRNRSLSPVCKHTRVMTNGSLRPLRKRVLHDESCHQRVCGTRSLVLQAAHRRRNINHQELSAIREYSITSDDQRDSDEEQSYDESMCDISKSWRYGLCEDRLSGCVDSSLNSEKNLTMLNSDNTIMLAKLKSNSLPASTPRPQATIELPKRPGSVILKQTYVSEDEIRRPPRAPKSKIPHFGVSTCTGGSPSQNIHVSNLRPTMGLQGLQQRPSSSKIASVAGRQTGPKTLAPRSPLNPNPPFGFPNPPSPPGCSPSSPFQGRKNSLEAPPASPRTNSRSGGLITRNFSISDDEGGQRLSRRQVTITRHESAYKEAADKGYLLPPSSPIDPYWLTWKLGVLQKTVEEVGSRLEESEKVVGAWGPLPQDQNLADQHVHNIRKFREILPDLQRGIDDVNDQAARFSAHNVPLTPVNSAALHDLNNRWKNLETTVNDRWRQVAGRSREVTPLTPAQLASSVCPPWERATATNKVPYYINHAQETTHWDHPQMMDLLDSLSEFNHIKFSAYRTATKLRSLQKKLSLDRAKLQLVTDVFDEHGLRGQNDRLIDVNDMVVVLSTLYGRIASDYGDINTTIATDLCLNWLLNVYDSQRTGQMRVLSFRIGLICLCRGHLEEKYRYMFRLIADPNRLVDQRKLGLLLHDCVQVPRQLGEVAAFGGSNIEPSVRSCFTKAGKDRESIEAVHFLTWVQQEPQSLVWLAVLHRVAASESVQHQVKCNICKTYPIVGLRYRCLKCLSFDMCQRCFFEGRSGKSHKITHPMHEYCTATTAGDEMKDFTKALKNKFKSKRSLQKHTKKGYLPVQTVLEGDPLESPSPSPSHNVSSQDMHSRLELYASRLAEVELRTNSNSTPDSEDEHGLIAQYCQSLSSSDAPFPVPKSPLQIMASVDADQKDELEQMIRDLEEENKALQAEYERLKSEQPSGSILDEGMAQRSEAEMLAEAKLLREHKGRLEARMSILEDHNRQLEAQLQRLRQLLVEQQSGMGSPNKSSTLQTKSVTASQLAMDSPAKINGHSQGDLEKAVGSLVASMNREKESDSHSDSDRSDENDYDNTVASPQTKSQ